MSKTVITIIHYPRLRMNWKYPNNAQIEEMVFKRFVLTKLNFGTVYVTKL